MSHLFAGGNILFGRLSSAVASGALNFPRRPGNHKKIRRPDSETGEAPLYIAGRVTGCEVASSRQSNLSLAANSANRLNYHHSPASNNSGASTPGHVLGGKSDLHNLQAAVEVAGLDRRTKMSTMPRCPHAARRVTDPPRRCRVTAFIAGAISAALSIGIGQTVPCVHATPAKQGRSMQSHASRSDRQLTPDRRRRPPGQNFPARGAGNTAAASVLLRLAAAGGAVRGPLAGSARIILVLVKRISHQLLQVSTFAPSPGCDDRRRISLSSASSFPCNSPRHSSKHFP